MGLLFYFLTPSSKWVYNITIMNHLRDLINEEIPDINNPQFDKARRTHDWRNYVPNWAIEHWTNLPEDVRLTIAVMANKMADREEWD